jgi:hypothetical protein
MIFLIGTFFISCTTESGMYKGSQNTAIVILTLLYAASFYGIISFLLGKSGLIEAILSLVILFFLLICFLMTSYYIVGICFFIVGLVVFFIGKNRTRSIQKNN